MPELSQLQRLPATILHDSGDGVSTCKPLFLLITLSSLPWRLKIITPARTELDCKLIVPKAQQFIHVSMIFIIEQMIDLGWKIANDRR